MVELIKGVLTYFLPVTVSMALFYSSFMPLKRQSQRWYTAAAVAFIALLYHLLYLLIEPFEFSSLRVALNISALLTAIFLVQLLYKSRLYKKLLVAFFYLAACIAVEMALSFVVLVDWTGMGTYETHYVEYGDLVSFFMLGIALALRFGRRKTGIHIKRRFSWTYMALISICYFCICITILNFVVRGRLSYLDILYAISFAAVLVLFYINFEVTDSINKKNQEYTLQKQRHELLEEYYRKVEAHQNEIRGIKHDMMNQLLTLGGYMQEGGAPEVAGRQIDELVHQLSAGEVECFTPHLGMNALLGAKYRQAGEDGIICEFIIKLPAEIGIAENDLAIVVGNVLDNAIEACRYCHGQRYIRFKLLYQNHALVLYSENSTDGVSQDMTSRKADSQSHGLGMKRIKNTVERYGGNMQYTFEAASYSLELTMFARPPEKHDG